MISGVWVASSVFSELKNRSFYLCYLTNFVYIPVLMQIHTISPLICLLDYGGSTHVVMRTSEPIALENYRSNLSDLLRL
jgi:hypothetical protein